MDKTKAVAELIRGAEALGMSLSEGEAGRLWEFAEELLRWNRKVNLTAITDPVEVIDKHLLDSVAVLQAVGATDRILDLGAGAGFPALPMKLVRPGLSVTLVDSVSKKVAFIRQAIIKFALKDARAVHLRATGDRTADGLGEADVVVSRALMAFPEWVRLASGYLAPRGRIIAMLGREDDRTTLSAQAAEAGLRLVDLRTYELPISRAHRALAVVERP